MRETEREKRHGFARSMLEKAGTVTSCWLSKHTFVCVCACLCVCVWAGGCHVLINGALSDLFYLLKVV